MSLSGRADAGSRLNGVPPRIAVEMAAQGGRVTFARFMDLALTHPVDGYYCQTQGLLGPRGHFSTAPRLSQAFCGAVRRLLEELIGRRWRWPPVRPAGRYPASALPRGRARWLLELGAGEADLGLALLRSWDAERPDLRESVTYTILEVGEHLRARQRRILAKVMEGGWPVRWVEDVGEALSGTAAAVVVGNEFIDALPVHLVDVRGPRPAEAWVELQPAGVGAHVGPGAERGRVRRSTKSGTHSQRRRRLNCWLVRDGPEAGALRPLTATASSRCGRQRRLCCRARRRRAGGLPPDHRLRGVVEGARRRVPSGRRRHAPSPPYATRLLPASGGCGPLCSYRASGPDRRRRFSVARHHGRRHGFETVLFTTVADLLRADGGEDDWPRCEERRGVVFSGALDADHQANVSESTPRRAGTGCRLQGDGAGQGVDVVVAGAPVVPGAKVARSPEIVSSNPRLGAVAGQPVQDGGRMVARDRGGHSRDVVQVDRHDLHRGRPRRWDRDRRMTVSPVPAGSGPTRNRPGCRRSAGPVEFETLQDVRVVAQHEIGAGVDDLMGQGPLGLARLPSVLGAPVEAHDDEVGLLGSRGDGGEDLLTIGSGDVDARGSWTRR